MDQCIALYRLPWRKWQHVENSSNLSSMLLSVRWDEVLLPQRTDAVVV